MLMLLGLIIENGKEIILPEDLTQVEVKKGSRFKAFDTEWREYQATSDLTITLTGTVYHTNPVQLEIYQIHGEYYLSR